ncbi:MAG: MMPL family transporter [Acidimicrobiia bacterium]
MQSLARTCYRHRRIVLGSWIVVLVALSVLASSSGGVFKVQFGLPGSESERAFTIHKERGFEQRAGVQAKIVFTSADGVRQPQVRTAMDGLFSKIEHSVSGTQVVSPYDNPRQISRDGTVAYAELDFKDRNTASYQSAADTIRGLRDDVKVPGLEIELGNSMFKQQAFGSEAIGLVLAMIILLVAFGSLLAMGLPIATALVGIGCGVAVVKLVANVLNMPDFTTQAVLMISIGVGIDYALFIVTRYREVLASGRDPESAVVVALDTAGRAVLFAGSTVVIALLGLLILNTETFRGVAVGTTIGVLLTMAGSVTLLPALLGFVGRNIDRFGLPRRTQSSERPPFWNRWAGAIQRRPWPAFVGALLVLLVIAAPIVSMRLGFGDDGNAPRSETTRKAYDLLAEGFGPGFNGPLILAADTPGGPVDLTALDRLSKQLDTTPGVAFVTPPIPNQAGTAAIMQVIPTTSPQDVKTDELVDRLRDHVIPAALAGSSTTVAVGGFSGIVADFAAYTTRMLPVVVGLVLLLSFLLLMVVFRSLLVPLKAVIMNLLSVGAAYGVMVAIFQWGWGASLIGVGKDGPIEAWGPLMLFAVVFGLSMDYEVFLLSRIKEEYDRTGDNAVAVADGLAHTARVITAAAAIMVCVFGAFALGPDRALKMFGIGMATAVFVDATVVRLILVPATMELLGDRNWWIPRWLDRILPRIHIEGHPDLDAELESLTAHEAGARTR